MQWPLPWPDDALRANGAIELVLDLQQARGKLAIIVAIANADRRVGRIRFRECFVKRGGVALQVVVADRERILRLAQVAETSHPQRSCVGKIEGPRRQLTQLVGATLDEG